MEKISENRKVILLGIILLIVAGIIVVVLKGFNLPIEYQKHETINFKIGTNFDLNKVDNICKEVFGNRAYSIREVELFNDSAAISTENFTDEDKQNLVDKINGEFGTNFTVPSEDDKTSAGTTEATAEVTPETAEAAAPETAPTSETATDNTQETEEVKKAIEVKKVANYRLRDMVRQYVKYVVIIAVIVAAYIGIRFIKINSLKKLLHLFGILAGGALILLSLIAILRIPVTPTLINGLMAFVLLETICYIGYLEKELKAESLKN